jgi:site-specific DNA-methyltransferase (adenine-specific)
MVERSWLFHGDCVQVMRAWNGECVDALITDPPAGIGFMGKAWDGDKGGRDAWVEWLAGVMGEAMRLLKPGAHGLVWALPRTSHWTATALENAGFEIRDVVMHLFGSGFPKSKNVSAELGTALKPAAEHWILVRKPLGGTIARTVELYGTGALNIAACRIDAGADYAEKAGDATLAPAAVNSYAAAGAGSLKVTRAAPDALGRWPANVVLDEEAAAALDAQTGTLTSRKWDGHRNTDKTRNTYGAFAGKPEELGRPGDSGGASRFYYVAKPSRSERDAGCADLPLRTSMETVHRKPDSAGARNPRAGAGRGAGAPIIACRLCGLNLGGGRAVSACSDGGGHAPEQVGTNPGARNHHPTVKAVTLMRYLAKLITPPGGVVLDPFMGSGTTGIACLREGYRFAGIEQDPDYLRIAQARLGAA